MNSLGGISGLIAMVAGPAGAQAPSAIAPPPTPYAVAPGTEVELMVLEEVNTRVSSPGSIVRLRLNRAVTAGGRVVLPVGTPAFGVVDALEKSNIALSRGSIAVHMTHIAAPSQIVPLRPEPLVYQARGGKADDVAKLLIVPLYAAFSPANSAKLKAGDIVRARVADATAGGVSTGNTAAP